MFLNFYLPEEEVKKYGNIKGKIINAQSPEDIDKLNEEISSLNDEILPNDRKKSSLKQIQNNQKRKWEKSPEQLETEAYQKGKIWELPAKSWADLKVKAIASTF